MSEQPRQVAPLLEGIVEQGGQHLAGELDGDLVDEVEGLADRQLVEDRRRPARGSAAPVPPSPAVEKIGVTTRRWASCSGGSSAMKLEPLAGSRRVGDA